MTTGHRLSVRAASYVLPLRSTQVRTDLAPYLQELADHVHVIVVDGSDPAVFTDHAAIFPATVVHVSVDEDLRSPNGKVAGVLTGLRRAEGEAVIIADDDVRYDATALRRVVGLLADVDVVVPQNYFRPLPWHARWDTARTLINRAFGMDYPGTLALRGPLLLATGGYDGSVLFENLELLRTVYAAGGTIRHAPDIYIAREPPTARHFLGQRLRQAYDSSAQPARLAAELTLLPGAVTLSLLGGAPAFAVLVSVTMAIAEFGRRRHGGTAVFPPSTTLFAPAWAAERAVCAWIGQAARLRGGVRYGDHRLRCAAHSVAHLRRRLCGGDICAPSPQVAGLRGLGGYRRFSTRDTERARQPEARRR